MSNLTRSMLQASVDHLARTPKATTIRPCIVTVGKTTIAMTPGEFAMFHTRQKTLTAPIADAWRRGDMKAIADAQNVMRAEMREVEKIRKTKGEAAARRRAIEGA